MVTVAGCPIRTSGFICEKSNSVHISSTCSLLVMKSNIAVEADAVNMRRSHLGDTASMAQGYNPNLIHRVFQASATFKLDGLCPFCHDQRVIHIFYFKLQVTRHVIDQANPNH